MKQYLQNRYSDLQKSKIRLRNELAAMNVASDAFRKTLNELQTLTVLTEEIEYLINGFNPEPEKIVPVAGIQERTPEENDSFHDELINKIFSRFGSKGNTFQNSHTALRIKTLNQYFVNITSLQWVTGQIVFLESLETNIKEEEAGFKEAEGFDDSLKDLSEMVDSKIGELYSAQSELQHNCNLLEKQLNIK